MLYNKRFKITSEGDSAFCCLEFSRSDKLPRKNVTSVSAIIFRENKILVVYIDNEKRKTWDIPGGHLENNESPKEALKREICEEARASIKNIKLLGYLESDAYKEKSYIAIFTADIKKLYSFKSSYESTDRDFFLTTKFIKKYNGNKSLMKFLIQITKNRV